MDHLKILAAKLGGKIHTQNLYNWNFNETSLREMVAGDYKGYKIVVNEFGGLFEIGINAGVDFAFSISIPNKLFGFTTPRDINTFPYKVYFNNNEAHPLSRLEFPQFLDPLIDIIVKLKLSEKEGVFFYQNFIKLVLIAERDLVSILEEVTDLLSSNSDFFRKEIRERIYAKNIPENLRPLIPLLKKWSISDDSEREQLMAETSERQKKKLFETVYPFMTGINEFLDSFKDEQLCHEAILLGNLAELVSEIKSS